MQEKYLEFKLGAPDYVDSRDRRGKAGMSGGSSAVTAGSTTVEFEDAGEHEDIFVTSEDAVKCVKLRWNYKIPKSARFLATPGNVHMEIWNGME